MRSRRVQDQAAQSLATDGLSSDALRAHPMADFFALRIRSMWRSMRHEALSFWATCGYLFIEYVRPQSIMPALDVLPWGKACIVVAVVSWLTEKQRKWVAAPTNKWMVAFLLVIIASSIAAYWPSTSWQHFMDFFSWFLIYFLIINTVNNEKRLFVFLLIFLIASFKLSQHGARTWAMRGFSFEDWGLLGPPGPFHNSGEFSVQMLMFMPLAYRLTETIRPWLSRFKYWLLLLLPATAIMTVIGASSRGSQIALVFQLYHTFLKGRFRFKTLALTAIVITAGFYLLPEEQLDRFRTAGDDTTSQQRLLYWKHGVQMIQDHPVLGVGYFNFIPYYTLHHREDLLFQTAQLPHNIFVQIGTDAGFIGLFVYVALIWSGFRATRQIREALKNDPKHWLFNLSRGYDAAFIGFLIAGQFVTIGYYPFMWILIGFIVATNNIATRLAASDTGKGSPKIALPGRRLPANRQADRAGNTSASIALRASPGDHVELRL